MKKFAFMTTVILAYGATTYAADDQFSPYYANDATFMPLSSRLTVIGTTGQSTFGEVNGMVPIVGTTEQMGYLDADIRYGQHEAAYGSLGVGYRGIVGEQAILGGYILGERERIKKGTLFTVVNPGLEMMTDQFDAHINGYFPVGKKQQYQGNYFANQIGKGSAVNFSGHTQYQESYAKNESIGTGIDTEVGMNFANLNRTRIFGGGYYFKFDNASTTAADDNHTSGVMAGVEVPFSQHVSFEARDTYDKLTHNTALVSLKFTLGGLSQDSDSVQRRLLDPIERHVAATDGRGVPTKINYLDRGQVIQKNNIWFFAPDGTSFNATTVAQDGTYEHPYSNKAFGQLSVNGIDTAAKNASLYLAPATYRAESIASDGTTQALILNPGQSVAGRSSDFYNPAAQNTQVILSGALGLVSNNQLTDLALINNTDFNLGNGSNNGIVVASGATQVMIDDIQIGSPSVSPDVFNANNYNIDLLNNGNLQVNATQLYAGTPVANLGSIGIDNTGILQLNNSQIYTVGNTLDGAFGLQNHVGGSAVINNSHFFVGTTGLGTAYGMDNAGTLTLNNIKIDTGSNTMGRSDGFINEEGAKAIFNNSAINVLSLTTQATGLINQTNSQVTLNNTTFNVKGQTASGITNYQGSTATLTGSTLKVTGLSGNTIGLQNLGNSIVTLNNTQMSVTGNQTAVGLDNEDTSQLTVNQSDLTVNSANQAFGLTNGVQTSNGQSMVTVNGSTFNINSTGLGATGIINAQGALNFVDSTLNTTLNTATTNSNNAANGILNAGNLNISNASKINVNFITSSTAVSGNVTGITNNIGGTATTTNSDITVNNNSIGSVYGIINNGNTTFTGGNLTATSAASAQSYGSTANPVYAVYNNNGVSSIINAALSVNNNNLNLTNTKPVAINNGSVNLTNTNCYINSTTGTSSCT